MQFPFSFYTPVMVFTSDQAGAISLSYIEILYWVQIVYQNLYLLFHQIIKSIFVYSYILS